MCRLVAWCLLWVVLALPASAGERRIALVVGASAYKAVPALPNTLNDANGIAAALKRLEFEVDTLPNPDAPPLRPASTPPLPAWRFADCSRHTSAPPTRYDSMTQLAAQLLIETADLYAALRPPQLDV
jgi:hypothetical protein